MARIIVITSGKGGVGKTSICAHLGTALANKGKRVVLIDVDIGLNNLDVVMGVENKVVFDIVDVIQSKCRPKQALIQDFNCPNLYIMPSAQSYDKSAITISSIKAVVDELDPYFDYILLDCPAGIDIPFKRAVNCAKEAILVVTPHLSSIRDADKVLSILKTYNITNTGLIVNRIRGDMVLDNDMLSAVDIASLLNIQLLGVVPEDDKITLSSMFGDSLVDGADSSRAFELLADNITNGTSKIYDCTKKYRGIFGYIKRSIKRRV